MLLTALRYIGYFLLGLLALAVVLVSWSLWAWRDIPVAELEQKHGGPELRMAVVDGVPFRYRLEGADGGKPVLVLIHSHFFDMRMWDAWMPTLLPDFAVFRYDMPAHGLTGADPSNVYNLPREARLLEGLLQQAGINGEVSVVGSSIGGSIAFTFAANHPERTRAAVIMHSGGLKREHRGRSGDIPSWASVILRLVPPSGWNKFLDWMVVDPSVLSEETRERFVDMWRRDGNREAEIERLRQFKPTHAEETLAKVRAPTLVLWGEDNPQVPVEMAKQFADALTSARKVEVRTWPKTGHLLPIERPRESAEAVRDFVLAAGSPE